MISPSMSVPDVWSTTSSSPAITRSQSMWSARATLSRRRAQARATSHESTGRRLSSSSQSRTASGASTPMGVSVTDFLSFVDRNPFEFEQSIHLLRLTDDIKKRRTNCRRQSDGYRPLEDAKTNRSDCRRRTEGAKCPQNGVTFSSCAQGSPKQSTLDVPQLPKGCNLIVSI